MIERVTVGIFAQCGVLFGLRRESLFSVISIAHLYELCLSYIPNTIRTICGGGVQTLIACLQGE